MIFGVVGVVAFKNQLVFSMQQWPVIRNLQRVVFVGVKSSLVPGPDAHGSSQDPGVAKVLTASGPGNRDIMHDPRGDLHV